MSANVGKQVKHDRCYDLAGIPERRPACSIFLCEITRKRVVLRTEPVQEKSSQAVVDPFSCRFPFERRDIRPHRDKCSLSFLDRS